MKQMRRSAPWLIVVGAYLLGVSVALYAADPNVYPTAVTREEMKSFVYEALATSGVLVIGVAAGLLAWILARDREINGKRLDQIAQGLSDIASGMHASMNRAIEALEAHNGNPLAHTAASEHNHGPMKAMTNRIEEKLDGLISEHRLIRETERCLMASVRRDPADSPHPRRAGDPPGFDGTKHRGRS